MAKKIDFNLSARDGLKRGVDALANAVKVTLGPNIKSIDQYAFGGCSGLTGAFDLPSEVSVINDGIFYGQDGSY